MRIFLKSFLVFIITLGVFFSLLHFWPHLKQLLPNTTRGSMQTEVATIPEDNKTPKEQPLTPLPTTTEPQIAGQSIFIFDQDQDQDGLIDVYEYLYGTHPLNPDSDRDGYPDGIEVDNGYNPLGAGRPKTNIIIEKIKLNAPVIWSEKEEEVTTDLKNGLVHFPKTSNLGQSGNILILGHSSGLIWEDSKFDEVLKNLNKTEVGDLITFEVSIKNNWKVKYYYNIIEKTILKPDDPEIYRIHDESILTLSTCWPIGSDQKRLVVKAKLITLSIL